MPNPQDGGFYGVMLPCGQDDFKEFISSLLGKPQEIKRLLKGKFELSKDDLFNTFHLVDQRIIQQNEASLTQFTTKISYNDNSSILLNSIDDFMAYNEVRPLMSESIELTWIYLIKFRDKNIPEKQTISLTIKTQPSEKYHDVLEDEFIYRANSVSSHGSGFLISIEHTARSWGVDIESLLVGHIRTIIKKKTKINRFLDHYDNTIGLFVGISFFALCIFGMINYWNNHVKLLMANFIKISQKEHIIFNIISDKIDFISEILTGQTSNGLDLVLSIVFFASIILSVVVGITTSSLCESKSRSFLLLTPETIQFSVDYKQKTENRIPKLIFFVVSSLSIGILSNYISKWIL